MFSITPSNHWKLILVLAIIFPPDKGEAEQHDASVVSGIHVEQVSIADMLKS